MNVTKEQFRDTIIKLQKERKKEIERQYAGYLVDSMYSYRKKVR